MARPTSNQNLIFARMFADLKRSFKQSLEEMTSTPLKLKSDIGEQLSKSLKQEFKELTEVIKQSKASLNVSSSSDKVSVDGIYGEEVVSRLGKLAEKMGEVSPAMSLLGKKIMDAVAAIKLEVPQVQNVRGVVEIAGTPKVEIPQFQKLVDSQYAMRQDIKEALKKDQSASKSIKIDNLGEIKTDLESTNKELVEKLTSSLDKVIEAISKMPKTEFPEAISINNFPPQKIPQPVTNININPMRGVLHTTATTVTTTLTTLPGYGQLTKRRSLQIYNNSSDTTIFIGGSGVSASNGLPVPPLSFSPAIDAGPNMIVYGITSSGSANARVIEISNDTGA